MKEAPIKLYKKTSVELITLWYFKCSILRTLTCNINLEQPLKLCLWIGKTYKKVFLFMKPCKIIGSFLKWTIEPIELFHKHLIIYLKNFHFSIHGRSNSKIISVSDFPVLRYRKFPIARINIPVNVLKFYMYIYTKILPSKTVFIFRFFSLFCW